jgi:hypothetical protein
VPRSLAPLNAPRFLLDRSVGRYVIAEGMQADGFEVETLASLYGERRAQGVKDVEWLEVAGTNALVVITADSAIRRRPSEIAAVERYGVKMFSIANGHLTGPAQLALVRQHMPRILREARTPGPWIWSLSASAVKRVWPRTN